MTSSDASGCTVDWSWLTGQQVIEATSDLQHLRLRFASGQTLEVRAANWQGEAFLAFNPWKPSATADK